MRAKKKVSDSRCHFSSESAKDASEDASEKDASESRFLFKILDASESRCHFFVEIYDGAPMSGGSHRAGLVVSQKYVDPSIPKDKRIGIEYSQKIVRRKNIFHDLKSWRDIYT